MCGIVGIFGSSATSDNREELLRRMMTIIRHRGPDECGLYIDDHIGLGHTRLSIIGIHDGIQPICNEDQSLWIVFNGEIFNYLDLKADLIRDGHRFRTQTDTEVFLHLFETYGPKCLNMINGQFAVAIWNSKTQTLFLARDRVGIRPLFYFKQGKKLLFASEIKSIFMDNSVPRSIDTKSLNQIFTFWTTLTPNTLFDGIKSVSPGHYILIRPGEAIEERPYWKIPLPDRNAPWHKSFEAAMEKLHYLIEDAVKVRMIADVPVGAYLSGGLDSAIIATLASKISSDHLKTFSINFQSSDFDERQYQDIMIDALGTQHTRSNISNDDIFEHLPKVLWHCEQPILRTSPVPMFLLSKLVHQNEYKVALTGEGADELFAGYNIFKEAKVRQFLSKQPDSKIRPLLLDKLYPYIFKQSSRARAMMKKIFTHSLSDLALPWFSHQIRWAKGQGFNRFLSSDMQQSFQNFDLSKAIQSRLPENFMELDMLPKAQFIEMDIFLSNYLLSSQGDRVALANSLEIRLPFLDHRIIDFAFQLPAQWKLSGLDEKYILKKMSEKLIPKKIRKRYKQPYRAPIKEIFSNNGDNAMIEELISERYLKHTGYFNPVSTKRLFSRFSKSDGPATSEFQNMVMMAIFSTQILHQQFIDHFSTQKCDQLTPDRRIDRRTTATYRTTTETYMN